ncbi:MAG: hypothetical protein AAGJ46_06605 [Planctomycetota bacterium]
MPSQLLSDEALRVLAEHFATDYTLRTIQEEFDNADIDCDEHHRSSDMSERRGLVYMYYHTLDLTNSADVHKVLSVFESVLSKLELRTGNVHGGDFAHEQACKTLARLTGLLREDGFLYEGGTITSSANSPSSRYL